MTEQPPPPRHGPATGWWLAQVLLMCAVMTATVGAFSRPAFGLEGDGCPNGCDDEGDDKHDKEKNKKDKKDKKKKKKKKKKKDEKQLKLSEYGFAWPGDPVYGFGLEDNIHKDTLGLVAKGNIVVGDYTLDSDENGLTDFEQFGVLNELKPYHPQQNPTGKTQPYVVDSSDAALGYSNAPESACGGRSSCFDGDYTQVDENGNGKKLDGNPRRFYESSLPDSEFKALVEPGWRVLPGKEQTEFAQIDATLFTNHAIAGFVPTEEMGVFGAMVAHEDAFNWGYEHDQDFYLFYDPRLRDSRIAPLISLPQGEQGQRPKLIGWEEVPQSGTASSSSY